MPLPPNRTPFDDDLVTDPNAPRHTQPLPARQPAPPASPNAQSSTQSTLPSGPSTVSGAPPLPRQVIPNDDDAPAKTTTLNPRRVPMSVIVGLAAVGGAIGVVMLSGAFGRLAPRPDSPGVITAEQERAREANQTAPVQTAPATPRVVIVPPRTSTPDSTSEVNSDSSTANPDDASPAAVPTPDIVVPDNQAARGVASGSNPAATSPRGTGDASTSDASTDGASASADGASNDEADSDTSRNRDRSSRGDRRNRDERDDKDKNKDKNKDDENSSESTDAATSPRDIEYSNGGVRPRYIERKRSYSIRPPGGFRIAQRGRRTVWQGPGKAQFLVEVGEAEGASPREGWEQLERSLQRKYGSRYRSYGILETTVNGRQAAIWEFELRTPKGRVRKMDVAVHDGKNGYAVLGSAPAADFENYRPVFERAIRSLEIGGNQSNEGNEGNDNNDRNQADLGSAIEGY